MTMVANEMSISFGCAEKSLSEIAKVLWSSLILWNHAWRTSNICSTHWTNILSHNKTTPFCERDAFQSASSQHNITSLTDWHRPVEIDPVRLSLLQKSTGGLSRKYNFCKSIPLTVHHWTILWAGLLYRIHRSKRVKVVEERLFLTRRYPRLSFIVYRRMDFGNLCALTCRWVCSIHSIHWTFCANWPRYNNGSVPQFSIFTSPNIHHVLF